jgi:poly(glycerol-phosphate) alpha-glucosyltransferase
MKTASVLTSISRRSGGLFESVRRLHQSLAEIPGWKVRVIGLRDEFTALDVPSWKPLPVETYDIVGWRAFGYSPELRRRLDFLEEDILHTHGIWEYPSVAVTRWHRRFRRPYVVSPHGMLDPWALKNSAWKKRIAWPAYEREHLVRAHCIRALCLSEAESIRALGLKNPICIIPNGIDLPPPPDGSEPASSGRIREIARGHKILLYLGRLHPKKGLLSLLEAWKSVTVDQPALRDTWKLCIAGWDQGGYEDKLKTFCAEQDLLDSVAFLGPQFEADKLTCYRLCDAFILPSLSEGLPMVILEAWANAKPVLMTAECNLPEGFTTGAAIQIGTGADAIANGLRHLVALSDADRAAIGQKGLNLVQDRFAWPQLSRSLADVYDWIVGSGMRPSVMADF